MELAGFLFSSSKEFSILFWIIVQIVINNKYQIAAARYISSGLVVDWESCWETLINSENEITESNETYHEIYNIGHGTQVELVDFVDEIEKNLGRKAERLLVAAHPADTPETWSDTTKLQKLGYVPTTPIPVGVEKFITWYKEYYGVN